MKTKYDSLKTEYDKLNIDLENNEENNNNTSSQFHPKNNNFNNKGNKTKKLNNKITSKFGMNNNNTLINSENLKYKKLYEDLKKKYDTTLKNISGGKKIKTVQDLFDKLDITEKDLNECRRIMNSSFNKIQDILSKDIFISGISNQPFDFNFNMNSFDSNIEQKFFVVFEKFIEFHMLRENQLKNLKEQNEVLNQNIHLNEDKKELFELNNDNDNKNLNNIISNIAYKSIAKNRRGYLFKDLSTNTKKAFDGYNKDIKDNKEKFEILDLKNDKNKIYENGNMINSKELNKINNVLGNNNISFNSKKNNPINDINNKFQNNKYGLNLIVKENNENDINM